MGGPGGVIQCVRHVTVGVKLAKDTQRKEAASVGYSHYTGTVGRCDHGPQYCGAVVLIGGDRPGIIVVVIEVPAIQVVHVAVTVVVCAIRHFRGVGEQHGVEVLVVNIEAVVKDGDHHRRCAPGNIPSGFGVYIPVAGAASLSGVVQ